MSTYDEGVDAGRPQCQRPPDNSSSTYLQLASAHPWPTLNCTYDTSRAQLLALNLKQFHTETLLFLLFVGSNSKIASDKLPISASRSNQNLFTMNIQFNRAPNQSCCMCESFTSKLNKIISQYPIEDKKLSINKLF